MENFLRLNIVVCFCLDVCVCKCVKIVWRVVKYIYIFGVVVFKGVVVVGVREGGFFL